MTHNYETHFITFEHIRIEIRYCRAWLLSCTDTAHLEVEAIDPIVLGGFLLMLHWFIKTQISKGTQHEKG